MELLCFHHPCLDLVPMGMASMATTGCFLFHLVVLLCFPVIPLAHIKRNITTDQSALLALKFNVFDPSHVSLTKNWTTRISVCNWFGVKCSSRLNRVVALNIPYIGLQGSIPPEIGNLSFLNWLDIRGNNLTGSLPQEMVRLRRLKYINLSFNKFSGEVPSWIGLLPNLQYLFMLNNSFTASLPLSLFNASKLEVVDLQFNQLQGNLPQEIGDLRELQIFNLKFNQLTGSIPPAIFNISSLKELYLKNNGFSGTLPVNMCFNLPKIQVIDLSLNQLSGKIQSRFNNCSELQVLMLSVNKFIGAIPREMGNLTMLTKVSLGRNDFQGGIPPETGSLPNLRAFEVAYSSLTGPVPGELGNLQKLEVLIFTSNALSGSIPLSIFNISSLRVISFTSNYLSGSLPRNIGQKLPNLQKLYLGLNNFTGVILDSISNATQLDTVELGGNQFTGSIPTSLGNLRFLETLGLDRNYFISDSSTELSFLSSLTNCRNLKTLSVSLNPLKGTLPSTIGNFSSLLTEFYASICKIQSNIPREIGNLSGLSVFSIGDNYLSGPLPMTFNRLLNLQALDLQDNQIIGSITDTFCNFRRLSILYLSGNQFSGQVPECIGNITSLRELYLDSNGFNLSIPASLGILKDLLQLNIHANSLSGSIPTELGNLQAALSIDLSENRFSGNVPATLGGLVTLMNLSLAHNELQGPIPETFGTLVSLQLLDLSQNNLTGEIPKSLESLSQLKYFNVSFNNLRGEIPSVSSFMNFTDKSFMSNEALCGGPPHLHFPTCSINSPRSRMKSLRIAAYVLLPSAFVVLALISIVTLFTKRRRRNQSTAQADSLPAIMHERVSFYDLQHATNGFSEGNLIARGSYGSVYKGVLRDGKMLAVKVFNLQLEGAFKSFDTKCEVLRNLRHRNLVKVISSCSNLDFKALVLEYMRNGSLENWLYSHNYFLDFVQRLDIMADVAAALDYLHHGYSFPVVHCDLKPSNVLLDEEMTAHVSDFGIAKLFREDESMRQTETLATIGYIAPEYGSEGMVSTRCDVYSFGILLMETFARKKPTDEMFSEDWRLKDWVADLLQNSATDFIDHNLVTIHDQSPARLVKCTSKIMELALACTVESSEERIDIKDALEELKRIKVHYVSK